MFGSATLLPRLLRLRSRPIREPGRLQGALLLVKVHPLPVQVVQIATEPETRACPLESLRFRCGAGVVVIGPLFPKTCVRRKAIECHLAGDYDLGRDRSLGRASLLAFEILDQLHAVVPRPTGWCEEVVQ